MNYLYLYFSNLKPFGLAEFYPLQEDYRICYVLRHLQ